MQPLGPGLVAIVGRHLRTTAVVITDFVGGLGEGRVPRPGGRWENRRRLLWADGRYPAIGFHRLLAERYPPYSFAKCKNVGASGGWSHQLVHGPPMHRGVAIAKS